MLKDKKSEGCSKAVQKRELKKCSKGDKCCTKTGKTVADCDNKVRGVVNQQRNQLFKFAFNPI